MFVIKKEISLFVFYYTKENKTLRDIIKENKLDVEIVDKLE